MPRPDPCGLPISEADRKRFDTLAARAALIGVTVHRIENDWAGEEYIASRWALTKAFNSLDALETWLNRVTGKTA
jgi:hypothetical protein